MSTSSTIEYRYADGNGNSFILTPNHFLEYKPIKREESSSGEYDGGTPVKRKISADEFAKVKLLIEVAIANKNIYIDNRVKGSGLIAVADASGRKTYLIRGNSTEAMELESYLRSLIK